MKKYIIDIIIGLISGIILTSAMVYAADALIPASEVSYESEYTESANVKDALDELLNKNSSTLVWTNPINGNSNTEFAAQTVNFDVEAPTDTTGFIVFFKHNYSLSTTATTGFYIKLNNSGSLLNYASGSGNGYIRNVLNCTLNSMTFDKAIQGTTTNNKLLIPYSIYAISAKI